MATPTVNVLPIANKVLAKALKEINAIMEEFDTKMSNVYEMLQEEMENLTEDDEMAGIIDEIMVRIMDDLPDRVCFMNELYGIANDTIAEESGEESTEEESSADF